MVTMKFETKREDALTQKVMVYLDTDTFFHLHFEMCEDCLEIQIKLDEEQEK